MLPDTTIQVIFAVFLVKFRTVTVILTKLVSKLVKSYKSVSGVGTVVPQVAQADAICKSGGTYNTYYPGDCDKYYKCENGQATEESCGWLHRFDENSSECKFHLWFIGSVNCSEATAPNKPTIAPTGMSS